MIQLLVVLESLVVLVMEYLKAQPNKTKLKCSSNVRGVTSCENTAGKCPEKFTASVFRMFPTPDRHETETEKITQEEEEVPEETDECQLGKITRCESFQGWGLDFYSGTHTSCPASWKLQLGTNPHRDARDIVPWTRLIRTISCCVVHMWKTNSRMSVPSALRYRVVSSGGTKDRCFPLSIDLDLSEC